VENKQNDINIKIKHNIHVSNPGIGVYSGNNNGMNSNTLGFKRLGVYLGNLATIHRAIRTSLDWISIVPFKTMKFWTSVRAKARGPLTCAKPPSSWLKAMLDLLVAGARIQYFKKAGSPLAQTR
jgi:hypothetical protein